MTYKEIKETYTTIESIDNRLNEIESIERSLRSELQQLNLLRSNIFKEEEINKYNGEVKKADKNWLVIINKTPENPNECVFKRRGVPIEVWSYPEDSTEENWKNMLNRIKVSIKKQCPSGNFITTKIRFLEEI